MTSCTRPLALLLLAVLIGPAGGCASVRPRADVRDPVPVYVGDFGVHSGLFLPAPDGRFVEYQFGDWRYAAEGKCWPQDALVALTASGQAAFGRMYHPAAVDKYEPELARKPKTLQRIDCERVDVYDLVNRLDARFAGLVERYGSPVVNSDGVEFVRDPGHYSVANNCNHLTAQSLRELGCDVSGPVVWSKFEVKPAAPGGPSSPPAADTAVATRPPPTPATGWASIAE
jgi:hypothetical protein